MAENAVHTPTQIGLNEAHKHEWVRSSFAGMKNVLRLSKKFKGNVQVLYNLYDKDGLSPYGERIAVRFGFGFPMKKKAKVRAQ